jgi:glycosyltransferase involved in cell wall biosynthesis
MARRLGVKFSVSVHAWDIYAQPPPLLARRLADADFVATCSRYNREQLRMLVPDVPADRIHMIYHGVDPLEFSPDRRPGKNLVLAVGRLEEKKGLGGLVEACRRLRDKGMSFRCTIVGDGPERKRLQRLIAEYGLRTTVILEGELSQEELMPLYRKAAVLAVPSVIASTGDRDALPNVILEALAMEIPVVASRVGAIPEVIEDARTGLLVEPGDAAALAAAIERVLAEPSLGSRLAGTGRVLILERFNVRTNAAALGRLFAAGDR